MTCYLILPIGVYGTIWIMLIAYVTRFLPYGMRYNAASILQLHKELEESAAMSGASWGMAFRRIVLPLLKPGLIAGWIYIVIVSIRELASSILLYSPGTEVVSVMIWELWQNGQYVELSALGVMMISGAVLLRHTGAAHWTKIRRRRSLRGISRAQRKIAPYRVSDRRRRLRQGGAGRVVRRAGWRVVHAARAVRLRQDYDLALHRRAGAADLGRDRGGRAGRLFVRPGRVRRAQPAQLRHGVPVLRHLAAHERVQERLVSAGGAQAAAEP